MNRKHCWGRNFSHAFSYFFPRSSSMVVMIAPTRTHARSDRPRCTPIAPHGDHSDVFFHLTWNMNRVVSSRSKKISTAQQTLSTISGESEISNSQRHVMTNGNSAIELQMKYECHGTISKQNKSCIVWRSVLCRCCRIERVCLKAKAETGQATAAASCNATRLVLCVFVYVCAVSVYVFEHRTKFGLTLVELEFS